MIRSLAALGIMGVIAAAPARADTRSFGEIAEEIVETIAAGRDVARLSSAGSNLELGAPRIGSLKGCSPKLLPGSSRYAIDLDWECPDPADNLFTRIYISDKKLTKIQVQPARSQMKPTNVALSAAKLDNPYELNKRFVEAVQKGADPTLGGLIPISQEQMVRLARFEGWHARPPKVEKDKSIKTLWMERRKGEGDGAETLVHIDAQGRPIGVWVDELKILIRTVTY